jgi:hypothetical protein
MKAKVVCCCIGRSWKQSSSSKRNNANGINKIAFVLWDIKYHEKASIFGKWQMRHELMILDWSL